MIDLGEIAFMVIGLVLTMIEPIALDYFWSKIGCRRERKLVSWIVAWGVIVGYILCRNQLVNMASGHVLFRYIMKNAYIVLYVMYA